MAQFSDKLVGISSRMAQSKVLNIIQSAFMMLLPVTMIGGFASLFNGLGIDVYQSFIDNAGLKPILGTVYQWTIGMIGLYLSFLVAYQFSKTMQGSSSHIATGLTSIICFLIATPYTIPEEPYAASTLPVSWLGASGMFSAIIIAFIVGGITLFCKKYRIAIRLPEQVPSMVASQFTSILPSLFSIIFFAILNVVISGTSFGSFHQIIYSLVSMPLQAVGSNIFGVWVLQVALYGLWFCGIHGGMTVGPIIMILFMQLQMDNMTAYQAGQELPNMVTGVGLSYGTGSLPLVIAALIFCKAKSIKSIVKLGFIPAFFGVDEPVYFGVPMILNPLLFIPWVLATPTIAVFGTYLLQNIGLLGFSNCTAGSNAANFPFFVMNTMNFGWAGLFWGLILFALCVLVYIPFVKAYDKQMLIEELKIDEKEGASSL